MPETQPVPSPWVEDAFRRLCDDFSHCMKAHRDFGLAFPDGSTTTVRAAVIEDLEHNTKHAAILVPKVGAECTAYPELVRKELESARKNAIVTITMPYDRHGQYDNQSLVFSNTVYVYTQTVTDLTTLRKVLADAGMKLALRDDEYLAAKAAHDTPDLFICHDSRDKDSFVRPLAVALQEHFIKVWYDEFSLSVGDSLIEKIDEGLKNCKLAVVVVSHNLLTRKKWSAREYRSLTSREIEDGRKVVLPI